MLQTLVKNSRCKLFYGLILLALLQIGDAWSTLSLPNNSELNPFSGWLIDHGILLQVKLFLAAIFILGAWSGRFNKRIVKMVWVLVVFYSLVVSWNIFLVIQS